MPDEKQKCEVCREEFFRYQLNGYNRCGECQRKIEESKNFTKDFDLAKDDQIVIRAQGSVIYGKVLTAYHYGRRDGWYIEYTIDESRSQRPSRFSGNYGYWKQGCDGGTVEKL